MARSAPRRPFLGLLIDQNSQLRWASASDQTAQTLEDGQERLAQGPCLAAFSQRAPAVIRDISSEPDWKGQADRGEFTRQDPPISS